MSDDAEIQQVVEIERAADGKRSPFDMDMREVIAAGLENAPIGVVTTPGTKNPKYIPAKPGPLPSPPSALWSTPNGRDGFPICSSRT